MTEPITPQQTNPPPEQSPPQQQQANPVPVPNSPPPPPQQHTPQSATTSGQDAGMATALSQIAQAVQGMPERIVDSLRESGTAPQQQATPAAGQDGQQQQQQQQQQQVASQPAGQSQETDEPQMSRLAKWWFG